MSQTSLGSLESHLMPFWLQSAVIISVHFTVSVWKRNISAFRKCSKMGWITFQALQCSCSIKFWDQFLTTGSQPGKGSCGYKIHLQEPMYKTSCMLAALSVRKGHPQIYWTIPRHNPSLQQHQVKSAVPGPHTQHGSLRSSGLLSITQIRRSPSDKQWQKHVIATSHPKSVISPQHIMVQKITARRRYFSKCWKPALETKQRESQCSDSARAWFQQDPYLCNAFNIHTDIALSSAGMSPFYGC